MSADSQQSLFDAPQISSAVPDSKALIPVRPPVDPPVQIVQEARPAAPPREAPLPAMRSRLYASRFREFLDLEKILQTAKDAYREEATAARLERVIVLEREHREMAGALERTENPADLRSSILGVLGDTTQELIKSVADEMRVLRDQLERRADPAASVREAFRRIGARVSESHRENQRALTEILPSPRDGRNRGRNASSG